MSKTRWFLLALLGALLVGLTACGNQSADPAQRVDLINSDPPVPGNAETGRELFLNTLRLTGSPNCVSCHVVEAGQVEVVGPSLVGIARVAGERAGGQSAEAYLYRSIVAPNEYIVEGYDAGIMPRTYALYLNQQQVADLMAYMLTLE
ncbi:MAG: cytochrome c [Chloroflexaceae bacterium]|nr:cytochrome c [Chloroflexaceae bacterium]